MIKCSTPACLAQEEDDAVFGGTSGGLWGPFWFCNKCDKELIEDMNNSADIWDEENLVPYNEEESYEDLREE